MDQSTKKTTNESDCNTSQVAYGKSCPTLGAFLFAWQQNHSVGCTESKGPTYCWQILFVLKFSVLKIRRFWFYASIESWSIDMRHLFVAKTKTYKQKKHSYKVKSKFSRWTNFPQHKLCLGYFRVAPTTWRKFARFVYHCF